jgi:hypothetical protein
MAEVYGRAKPFTSWPMCRKSKRKKRKGWGLSIPFKGKPQQPKELLPEPNS